jgi:hypothetical protein
MIHENPIHICSVWLAGWQQQYVLKSGYDLGMLWQSFFINTLTTPLLATLM